MRLAPRCVRLAMHGPTWMGLLLLAALWPGEIHAEGPGRNTVIISGTSDGATPPEELSDPRLAQLPAELPAPAAAQPSTREAIPNLSVEPAVDSFIPPDPTQAIAPVHGHSGCGCSACRGVAPTGPPPGVTPQTAWFDSDCPKAVLSEGWCCRPYYIDGFLGVISGDELIDNLVGQQPSFFGGVRLGLDFEEHWGIEGRLGWAEVEIANLQGPSLRRTADLFVWDASLLYYFASDLRIRPFVSIGVGAVDWNFIDAGGNSIDESVVGVPIGIGVKQRYDDWLLFRVDLTDNIAFGGGTVLGVQHNLSCTASCELRFGGRRTSYWPWQPRKYYSW